MGFKDFSKKIRDIFNAEKRSTSNLKSPDAWLIKSLFGDPSQSGVTVNENTALNYVAQYAATKVIAETLASMPTILYKRTDGGKERAVGHPSYRMLHLKANDEQTASEFKMLLGAHYWHWGDAYAEKIKNGAGYVVQLWPLLPWNMEVLRDEKNNKIYKYKLSNGNKYVKFPTDRILHIPNFSLTGLKGSNPVDRSKNAIGLGMAAEEYGNRFYANDARPGGVIQSPRALREETIKRMKKDWELNYRDMSNKHRVAILEEGMTWQEIGLQHDHAQFLETRKHQVTEVARFSRIPPHMLGDLERSTYSNIEHQSLEFIKYTMLPHVTKWEQIFTCSLLPLVEQEEYFYEFLVDALLRADIESRYRAYRTGREIGVLSPNDVRAMENLNKIEGGDEYHIPLSWGPLGQSGNQPSQEEEPQEEQQENSVVVPEKRMQFLRRNAKGRHTIAKSFLPVLEEYLSRVIKREIKDVKKGIDKYLFTRGKTEFDIFIQDFYKDSFTQYMSKMIKPVFLSLNSAVQEEVSTEINMKSEGQEKFIDGYIEAYVARHSIKSKRDIGFVIEKSKNNNVEIEDELDLMYDNWLSKRPVEESRNETVKGSNALARNLYILSSVSAVMWINVGEGTCPYCRQLDGVVIPIKDTFLNPGDNINNNDGGTMNISQSAKHPPMHVGCDCQIVPV